MYDLLYDLLGYDYLVHNLLELLCFMYGLSGYDLSNEWLSEIMIYF